MLLLNARENINPSEFVLFQVSWLLTDLVGKVLTKLLRKVESWQTSNSYANASYRSEASSFWNCNGRDRNV